MTGCRRAAVLAKDRPPSHEVRMRIAYQEACHLGHAQKLAVPPRELIRSIPGVTMVETPEQEFCCGSAGIYNIVMGRRADALKARKAANVVATGADAVVTANPGCLLQLKSGLEGVQGAPRLLHLGELLAMAYGLLGHRQKNIV